ncbi:MAG: hypothetical protein ACM32F_09395, partial [Betaproteobacteria bacterium]
TVVDEEAAVALGIARIEELSLPLLFLTGRLDSRIGLLARRDAACREARGEVSSTGRARQEHKQNENEAAHEK